jgi:predicted metalloendopeptidase
MKFVLYAAIPLVATVFTAFAADPALRSGIDKKNFDPAIRPQDDLFRSVNGTWLKDATIPPDRPADGAFFELRERSEKQVLGIIEEAARAKGDADAQKISDLYASFMNEPRVDEAGAEPIRPDLDVIASIKDRAGLIRGLAALQRTGVPGVFGIYVQTDSKKSDQYIPYIEQGGLGLPNESYYREAKYDELRKGYVAHIGKMLALAKAPNADWLT